MAINAQKTNLDKLPEKERNEYLLKTAYDAVMKHAPEWYRDYYKPEIRSFVPEIGSDKGRLIYSVIYYNNPDEEELEWGYSVAVGIYADTGEVRGLAFGDGIGYTLSPKSATRSDDEKPFYRPYPSKKK
jgi:hypothetical protein